jgi:hypothetical protein
VLYEVLEVCAIHEKCPSFSGGADRTVSAELSKSEPVLEFQQTSRRETGLGYGYDIGFFLV